MKEEPVSVAEKPKPVKEAPPSDEKAKQIKKLNQELAKMEEEIAELEKTVKDLEAQLADETLYNDSNKANKVTADYQLKKLQLGEVQAKWETLAEQILELES
jgi:ATP-binding cassette subfamily F protein 3